MLQRVRPSLRFFL